MPDKTEESRQQQIRGGGPDPRLTRGDAGPDAPADPAARGAVETGEGGAPAGRRRGKGQRYVVLHNMVGPHERGAVRAESEWPEGTDFDRLQDIGAVRKAERAEHDMDQVTVTPEAGGPPNKTYEQLVADKDKAIQQLQAEKADLQTKLHEQRAQEHNRAVTQQSAANATLIAEKDKRITELERQLAEAQAEGGRPKGHGERGK